MAQVSDYTGLITSAHNQKPNYMAMLAGVLQPFTDINNVIAGLPTTFDLDSAVGAQLDILGQWVGVSRNIPVPSTNTVTVLSDSTFRLLVKARIAANKWDGSAQQAASILAILYGPGGASVAFKDNQDMSFDIIMVGTIPSQELQIVLTSWMLPLKPAGVRNNNRWVTTTSGSPVLGLDIENQFISGLDVGAWGAAF